MKKGKILNRIYDMARPYMKTIILVVILAIIINIGEILNPYLIKIAIDDFLSKGISSNGIISVTILGVIYIAIVIIINLLDLISSYTTNSVGEKVVFNLRNKLYKYIERTNITFHDKTPTGKLFVRITNDVEDIANLFKDVIVTIFKDIVLIIAIAVIMLCVNVKLSLLAFSVIPIVYITSRYLIRGLNNAYTNSKNIRTKLNTFFAESIYGLKLIKVFNRQKEKQKECDKLNNSYYNSRKATAIYESLLPSSINLFENLAICIVIWTCVNGWFNVNLDIGVIYIFTTYIRNLFGPIRRIIENIEAVQEAIVSIDKVYSILEKEEYLEDYKSGKYLSNIKGKIEFKNVWFSYNKKDYILKDVSFVIDAKKSVALVGKTGSGKTTITNLINRFYEIDKGKILIDGVDIKDINIKSLRKNIGIILQDPFIYARSIKDNVRLNNNLGDNAVKGALRLSSADSFVRKLPNGIEEISQERGGSYSSGEKQLLAFARIFAHNPSIFALDEATANIDTNTEMLIQKSINIISKEKTSIFIAHRLSTIVNVDKIIVLDKGKIVESGDHSYLLKLGGYYSKLYNSYYTNLN